MSSCRIKAATNCCWYKSSSAANTEVSRIKATSEIPELGGATSLSAIDDGPNAKSIKRGVSDRHPLL